MALEAVGKPLSFSVPGSNSDRREKMTLLPSC